MIVTIALTSYGGSFVGVTFLPNTRIFHNIIIFQFNFVVKILSSVALLKM